MNAPEPIPFKAEGPQPLVAETREGEPYPVAALGPLRGAGMLALDMLPPAKRLLTRLTMGRAGRTPKLVRGVPL